MHLRRVLHIDLTATKYLQQIASRLHKNGGQLIFCNVHKEIGFGKRVAKKFNKVNISGYDYPIMTFNGKDEALEYVENSLLEELDISPTKYTDQVSLGDNDLCIELTIEEEVQLESVLKTTSLEKGEKLFSAGEHGSEVYMVISGEIDIRLPTTKHHYKRLSTCQPGSFFGELSLLYPGPELLMQ